MFDMIKSVTASRMSLWALLGHLWVPLDLAIGRLDVADHDLHRLAGQRVELLRQHQQLVGFDLPLVAHVDEADVDGMEKLLLCPPLWN